MNGTDCPTFAARTPSGPGCAPTRAAGPAIRIPVTHANRSRLRRLRQIELQPWIECGLAREPRPASYLPTPAPDRESQAVMLVLATAAFAMLIQSSAVITTFVENWDTFRAAVAAWLR